MDKQSPAWTTPRDCPSTPQLQRSPWGNSNTQSKKSFKKLLDECEAFTDNREGYIRFEKLLQDIKVCPSADLAAALVRVEAQRVFTWSVEQSSSLEKALSQLRDQSRQQKEAGDSAQDDLVNKRRTDGSSFWALMHSGLEAGWSRRYVRNLEEQYLEAAELLQLSRVNAEAGERLVQKLAKHFPDGNIPKASDVLSPVFSERKRLQSIIDELTMMLPQESIQKMEALAQSPTVAKQQMGFFGFLPAWCPHWTTAIVFLFLIVLCVFAHKRWPAVHGKDDPNAAARCAVMMLFVTFLFSSSIFPMFVTALLTPILVLVFKAVPTDNMSTLGSEMIAVMFDDFAFLILANLVGAAVIDTCGLGQRIINLTNKIAPIHTSRFLFAIMITQVMPFTPIGPYVMARALRPVLCDLPPHHSKAAKSLIAGLTLAANIGDIGVGPVNVFLLSFLDKAGIRMSLLEWMVLTAPTIIVLTLVTFILVMVHPGMPRESETSEASDAESADSGTPFFEETVVQELRFKHYICLLFHLIYIGCLLNLDTVSPMLGGPGIIGLLYMFGIFCVGILNVNDFNSLNWDMIVTYMSINVVIYAVRLSGLGITLTDFLIETSDVGGSIMWLNCFKLGLFASVMSSLTGRWVFLFFFVPLLLPIAVDLGMPLLVTFVIWVCMSTSLFTPYVTMELMLVTETVVDSFGKKFVSSWLMSQLGAVMTILGLFVSIGVSYPTGLAYAHYASSSMGAVPVSAGHSHALLRDTRLLQFGPRYPLVYRGPASRIGLTSDPRAVVPTPAPMGSGRSFPRQQVRHAPMRLTPVQRRAAQSVLEAVTPGLDGSEQSTPPSVQHLQFGQKQKRSGEEAASAPRD